MGKRLLAVSWLALYYIAGIPVWWHLTSIHRPALPFDDMLAADAGGTAGQSQPDEVAVGCSRAVLSFSLCNADPTRGIYSWDFEALRQRFLQPAIAALQPLMAVEAQSQVLYYTAARVNGTWSQQHRAFLLRWEDLPVFLDRSWAPDAGQLGTAAGATGQQLTLNWMVYVPPPAQRPLRIQLPSGDLSPTDSYVIPSWGGVVIYNPPDHVAGAQSSDRPATSVLPSAQLSSVFSIILAQLRQHLGLPDGTSPPGSCAPGANCSDSSSRPDAALSQMCAAVAPLTSEDVDTLMQRALRSNTAAAGRTLASLARLVKSLPTLAMPDLVGDQVRQAITAHQQAVKLAGQGALQTAVTTSQAARETAEAAFFHHSILAQLSFPAQHKMAVYLPFFLPATLPIVVGLLRELRRARHGSRVLSKGSGI